MNLFKEFRRLMPQEPQIIATLVQVYSDGSARATSLDGSPLRVIGANGYSTNDKVLVQGNRVVSKIVLSSDPTHTVEEYV